VALDTPVLAIQLETTFQRSKHLKGWGLEFLQDSANWRQLIFDNSVEFI